MLNLKDLKIGTRLGLAFAGLIGSCALIAALGSHALRGTNEHLQHIAQDRLPKVDALRDIKDNVNVIARAVRNMALSTDLDVLSAERKRIDAMRAENTKRLEALSSTIRSEQGVRLLRDVQEAHQAYAPAIDKAVLMALDGRSSSAGAVLMGEARKPQADLFKALDELVTLQTELVNQAATEARSEAQRHTVEVIALAVLAALAGLLTAWTVTRSVTRSMRRAVIVADAIRAGDLTQSIQVDRRDEVGELLTSLQAMQQSLRGLVGEVRSGVDSVTVASSQIAAGNLDLSSRTEQQAASLQESASSLEQLTVTVRQSADQARQARQLAQSASEVAQHGGDVVCQVVGTMEAIAAESRQMGEIIGVIDGIAFQTNILALNAAVEAARAGEQGRGFAVVAAEVRSLAQRSSEAAKAVRGLIQRSDERVQAGSQLAAKAGMAMSGIVEQARKVTDLVGEMSAAAEEQSKGIGQVNTAMTQLDQTTQQNAALVEESAAAASSLAQQAMRLSTAAGAFRLEATTQGEQQARTMVPPVGKLQATPGASNVGSARQASDEMRDTSGAPQLAMAGWSSF